MNGDGRPGGSAMTSRMVAIVIMVTTWVVLPGCMMLGGHGMHGNTQPSLDRAPPATVDNTRMTDRQTMRDDDTIADNPPPSPRVRADAVKQGSHAGYSTGTVALGVVLMVLMMAVMML